MPVSTVLIVNTFNNAIFKLLRTIFPLGAPECFNPKRQFMYQLLLHMSYSTSYILINNSLCSYDRGGIKITDLQP